MQPVFLAVLPAGADMDIEIRSGCPINLTMEVLGDRWSLVIIRDIMFGNRRHFRELLTQSEEGIASNILAARLKRLMGYGLITRLDDPSHSQKAIYSLTEASIQLVPMFAMIGAWGRRHLPVSEDLSIRAELLEEGGQALWDEFMADLRRIHLDDPIGGANGTVKSPVLARPTAAYLAVRAKMDAAG
jgi:DNA-binding HxlR family transcriptional regulator